MSLDDLQTEFEAIAKILGVDTELPRTAQHAGSAHAEYADGMYLYVVTERGEELERRATLDPDELLFWLARDLASSVAGEWELQHRQRSQDSRRLRFAKHLELLRRIKPAWADRQQADYAAVLARHPFDDPAGDRVDYVQGLREEGLDGQEAWRRAIQKYPEPKAPG